MRQQQAQHLLKDPRFSSINKRRKLESCIDFNPYLSISISTAASSDSASSSAATLLLQDVENVTVTVSGILDPSEADWIAVFSPATAPESVSLSLSLLPPHLTIPNSLLHHRVALDEAAAEDCADSGFLKFVCMYCVCCSSTNFCPLNEALYLETGDVSPQPLTCLYPVKVQLQLPWTRAQLDNNIKIT
jgi:hypothetical protein